MTRSCARITAAICLFVFASGATPLLLAGPSTKERLDSIERKLDSRSLLDMLNRVEQLQRDVQQLRGDIEVQTHTLEDLQRRQREQYLDIDRRLQQLETGQVGTAPPSSVLSPPPGSPPSSSPTATLPPVTPAAVPPVARQPAAPLTQMPGTPEQKAEYDTALAILREGRYAEAAEAFNRFLAANPASSYSDNASYWLGETYYVTRDFDRALATFKGLTTNYPNSPKVSDSRLKMGYIYYEKKDWANARQELEIVAGNYPGSTAARLADERLRRLQKEGH
jgi:tol-pal system protein YbgF